MGWLSKILGGGGNSRGNVAVEYGFEHYTEAISTIKELKQNDDYEELERVLQWCVEQTEEEDSSGVAPYYYEQLAILYRKQDRPEKEVEILERFADQPHAPGKKPEKLLERLEKTRQSS